MTIRSKIFLLAAMMLAILSVAVAIATFLQRETSHEIGGLIDYHIPITAAVAELDVLTFQYELEVMRLLHPDTAQADKREEVIAKIQEIARRIRASFERLDLLLSNGIEDQRNDVSDRIILSRVQASLGFVEARVEPYFALGEALLAQARTDRDTEARLSDFLEFEETFGRDLTKIREDLTAMTESSAIETHQQQNRLFQVSAVLLAVAAVLGLGLSALAANRLVRGLRKLVSATHAVEKGDLSVRLDEEGRDEVARLTVSFNSMTEQLRSVGRIKDTFGKYVDPRIVERLIDPGTADSNIAERRVVTVFFSDIAAFTAIGEQLTADRLAALLNQYFTRVTTAIAEHHGIIDKYIGDAIMAFWTPPFSKGDSHASEACLAALAQRRTLVEFRKELPEILGLRREVPEFHVRMALATGEVLLGTLGSPIAKSFTVIGDVVNVASRLEGANKIYGTQIIAAEETARLAAEAVETRELDWVQVVGKQEPVRLFEVMGAAGELSDDQRRLRDGFENALADYRGRRWTEAAAGFERCLQLAPEDGPSRLFLERVSRLREEPPGEDWDGVWRLTRK